MSTNISSAFRAFVATFLGNKEEAKRRFRESANPEAVCSLILNEFFVTSITDLHSKVKATMLAQALENGHGDSTLPNDAKPNIPRTRFPSNSSSTSNHVYQHKKYRAYALANAQTDDDDSKNFQIRQENAAAVGSFFIPNIQNSQKMLDALANATDGLGNIQIRDDAAVVGSISNIQNSRFLDARANAVANAQSNAPVVIKEEPDVMDNVAVFSPTPTTPISVKNSRNYSRLAKARANASSVNAASIRDSAAKNDIKIITNASSSSSVPNRTDKIKDEVDHDRVDNAAAVSLDSLSPFSSTNAHRHRILMMQKNASALVNAAGSNADAATSSGGQVNAQNLENAQILDNSAQHSAQYQSVLSNLKVHLICQAPPNNAPSSNVSYWRNSIYAKAKQQEELMNAAAALDKALARANAPTTTTTKNTSDTTTVSNSVYKNNVVIKEEVEDDDAFPSQSSSTLKNGSNAQTGQNNAQVHNARTLKNADNALAQAHRSHCVGNVERNSFRRRMPITRNALSFSAEALEAQRQEYAREKVRANAREDAQGNAPENAQINGQENASTRTGTGKKARNNAHQNMPLLRNALANAQQPSTSTGASSSLYNARANARVDAQQPSTSSAVTVKSESDYVENMPSTRQNDAHLANAQQPSTSAGASSQQQDPHRTNNAEPSTSSSWIRARNNNARNVVPPPSALVTQPHLSFTYQPHPNLNLYDDDFDVQEMGDQGRDPNLPEFPPIEHYQRREPSPCPLDSDQELDRLWRSDDELAPENVRADPDYRPSRGKKLGPRTPRVAKVQSTKKRPRVVEHENEGEEEENEEGTPGRSKKRNLASPGAVGNDKMKVKIVELNCLEDNCEVRVPSLAAYNAHLLEAHRIYSCRCYVEGCGASYESKSDMSEHIRGAHARLRQWPCCRCSKHFLSYPTLRTHQLTHQVGIFECDTCPEECNYTASNRMKVYGHIRLARKRAARAANGAGAGEGDSQEDSQLFNSQDSGLLEGSPLDDSEQVSKEGDTRGDGGSKKYSQASQQQQESQLENSNLVIKEEEEDSNDSCQIVSQVDARYVSQKNSQNN